MRDLTNRQLRLRRRPAGLPSPEDFELTKEPAPVPGAGQVLVRTLLLSIVHSPVRIEPNRNGDQHVER